MAARKAYSEVTCCNCGLTISDRMMWVDDKGFLCRDCALLTRYRRMKGEADPQPGRRQWRVGYRGRFVAPHRPSKVHT